MGRVTKGYSPEQVRLLLKSNKRLAQDILRGKIVHALLNDAVLITQIPFKTLERIIEVIDGTDNA